VQAAWRLGAGAWAAGGLRQTRCALKGNGKKAILAFECEHVIDRGHVTWKRRHYIAV